MPATQEQSPPLNPTLIEARCTKDDIEISGGGDESHFPTIASTSKNDEFDTNWLAFGLQDESEAVAAIAPLEATLVTSPLDINRLLLPIPSPSTDLFTTTSSVLSGTNLPPNLTCKSPMASHLAVAKYFIQVRQRHALSHDPSS